VISDILVYAERKEDLINKLNVNFSEGKEVIIIEQIPENAE
jgi:hypothetical protein